MQPLKWLAIILVYTALTLLCVYVIPADSFFGVIRIVLAFLFVVFVPGYCFVNLFFAEGKLDFAETLVLSLALSFSIAGITGLFIGISPIGLTIPAITQTLSLIVVALAVLAFLRKTGRLNLQLRGLLRRQPKTGPAPKLL